MSGHWVFYVAPFEKVNSLGSDSNTILPCNELIKLVKMNSNTIKSKYSYGRVVSDNLVKFQKSLEPDFVPISLRGTAVRRQLSLSNNCILQCNRRFAQEYVPVLANEIW